MIQNSDSLQQSVSRVDTLYIDRVDPLYHESYIKLLEKSNEQLSLVGNPLAWMIGALGLLFAAGAIVAGYHIITMGKSFQKEKRKLLMDLEIIKEKYKSDLDNLVIAHQEQLESTNKLLNILVHSGKVENNELKQLRNSIHRSTNAIKNASKDIPNLKIEHSRSGITKCGNCQKYYPISFTLQKEFKKGTSELIEKTCPHCGHKKVLNIKH
ncbi:hypothetical protein D0X99_15140 [Algoriphagus lacus]|uniref:Uncharacterized protein n=1 Tax=Algoriphagus lacus TaxID=2056311 RepID=A0A418PNY1_9BACT|nr:hypothetical protein [Algoriphagus lacus]RIW13582.1 hypothetical protein D0X99_15140 [Algoriphagus lacus]